MQARRTPDIVTNTDIEDAINRRGPDTTHASEPTANRVGIPIPLCCSLNHIAIETKGMTCQARRTEMHSPISRWQGH
jgi:hypothetical protein